LHVICATSSCEEIREVALTEEEGGGDLIGLGDCKDDLVGQGCWEGNKAEIFLDVEAFEAWESLVQESSWIDR
jgi:hypothetical protein